MAGYLTGLTTASINVFWEYIKRAIIKSSKRTDFLKYYPLDHIKQRLLSKDWQCWASNGAIFITCISIFPSGIKSLEILYVCGSGMHEWDEIAWNILKSFAKENDCKEIRFENRPGWKRIAKRYEPDLNTRYMYKVNL